MFDEQELKARSMPGPFGRTRSRRRSTKYCMAWLLRTAGRAAAAARRGARPPGAGTPAPWLMSELRCVAAARLGPEHPRVILPSPLRADAKVGQDWVEEVADQRLAQAGRQT